MQWDLAIFCVAFIARYLRLFVNAIAFGTTETAQTLQKPTYFSDSDVTVIVPTTLADGAHLVECIGSILDNTPVQVFLVVANSKIPVAERLCKENGFDSVVVLGVPKLGKRLQLIRGLESTSTSITVFADDDVIWPSNRYLSQLLTAFEDPHVGAAGTNQRVIRDQKRNVWNFLGACYLERRNFNTFSTNGIDGGISTLSGRTSAYRTGILKNKAFFNTFRHDSWLGYNLNTDDDKMLTRWTYSHGWKIKLLFLETDVLYTTLESSPKFLSQCLRWARAHWRGNIRVILHEDYWWKKHAWTLYASYFGSLLTPAVVIDGGLLYLLNNCLCSLEVNRQASQVALTSFVIWILFSKIVKLLPHFLRHPSDISYIPASILFSYLHGFINMYALLTLHVTAWGSRVVADEPLAEEDNAKARVLDVTQRVADWVVEVKRLPPSCRPSRSDRYCYNIRVWNETSVTSTS